MNRNETYGENHFIQNAIVLAFYYPIDDNLKLLSTIHWDIAVFDEAHRLRKHFMENDKKAERLRTAINTYFKPLLTATPMENSLMDIYGLINFINEGIFPNPELLKTDILANR